MLIWLRQIGLKDDLARTLAEKLKQDGYRTRHDVYEDISFNDADLSCYKKPEVGMGLTLSKSLRN